MTAMARDHAERAAFAVLSLLLALPVLWVRYPPMTDLPAHAALVAVLAHWNDPAFDYPALFRLHLGTPYLVPYGLGWLLSRLVPVLWAVKILVVGGLVGLPWATRLFLRRVGSPVYWSWLVFPAAFGHAFHWGFLTFVVASPLVLLFVAVYLPYSRRPTLRRGIALALFLVFLFLCHALVAGLAGAICLGLALPHLRPLRGFAVRCAPFVPAGLVALGWLLLFVGSDQHPEGWMPIAHSLPRRLVAFPGIILGWGGSPSHSVAGLLLLAFPFLLGTRPSRRLARWWPFGVCLGLYLLWPEILLGVAQLGQRLAVFVLPFLLFALEPAEPGDRSWLRPRTRRLATFLVAAGLLVATWPGFVAWERETEPFQRIVGEMEPHRRVLSLVFLPWSPRSPAPVYLHFPSWYAVEKGGVVDPSLAAVEQIAVHYRPARKPPLEHEFPWIPQTFDWTRHRGADYDYFLIRAPADPTSALFPPGEVERVARDGLWWLYRSTD